MPQVVFTANLQRHVACPPCEVQATTVRTALDQVFQNVPRLRDYIVDEQGALRKHMVIFVNGAAIVDREKLSDEVPESGEVYVMQALSGG